MATEPETRPAPRGRGPRALRALPVVAIVLFVALLVYGLAIKAPPTTIDDALARAQAPAAPGFELPVLERGAPAPALDARLGPALRDGAVAAAELRGVPVVLNYWASWCPPCRDEAPVLERAWREQRSRGVAFVGLNMQDVTDDARAFLREFRVSYLNVRDRSDETARRWGVTGLPETFFLSAGGRVVGHVIGVVSPEQLREGIAAARAGRPLAPLSGGAQRGVR
ncbi:MAG: TlpA family protein disulfide reductase [Actinomycetota bacterium]|nr:TlpA family protein disulfide reductase [Actinomycetota bacterium]